MVPVNSGVLAWVRASRGLDPEMAAELLGWPVEQLIALESSEEISIEELESLGAKYRISTATLLMPEALPPDRYAPRKLSDFRLLDSVEREPLSLKTQMRIENAYELIELMAEVNDDDNELAPRPLLPAFSLTDEAERAARQERVRMGLDIDAQLGWETDREAFLRWREVIEAGEIVVHKVALPEKSVRGFALHSGGYALIAANSNDDHPARVFTLWHEYAHLLLRMGGISDQNRQVQVERWCNQFAANFLMPAARFKEEYYALFPAGGPADDWQVARMARRFKVSKSAAAIRFEELGLAARGFYDKLKAEWVTRPRKGGPKEGNDQIDVELGRFGTTHVTIVGTAVERGIIDRLEAQYALDVPPDHLTELTAAARRRHLAYGPPPR
jgi:Zn-dependent peptidase ImmA (M78 family)